MVKSIPANETSYRVKEADNIAFGHQSFSCLVLVATVEDFVVYYGLGTGSENPESANDAFMGTAKPIM